MLTDDQILDHLRKMPDGLKPLMEIMEGKGVPIARVALMDTDKHGNRLVLVCGIEYAPNIDG